MDKRESFENAIKNARSVGFRGASQKLNAINLAAEFAKRGINTENFEQ